MVKAVYNIVKFFVASNDANSWNDFFWLDMIFEKLPF